MLKCIPSSKSILGNTAGKPRPEVLGMEAGFPSPSISALCPDLNQKQKNLLEY